MVKNANGSEQMTVVGLGASAGGLTALQSFFDALAVDTGMSFVVVTHLHPEHESILHEILQKHTTMPVQQVKEKVSIEANHVYVISPNREIVVTDSHLDVAEFEKPRGQRLPIDHFFRSLADAHAEAVAIILSGGGTDGAVGIKSIKERGGLLMVQDPADAQYDSMPRAAIATGLIDVVLPADQLAQKLVAYRHGTSYITQDPDHLTTQEEEVLQRILAQVQVRTGNDFSQYKRSTILRRIQRRVLLNGYTTLDAYLGHLRYTAAEAHSLFNDLLIGVTNFFRDRDSWDALITQVIPKLFEDKGANDSIRVWTIGCSTGEEAYSMAIILMEHLSTLETPLPTIQVFASDLDDSALKRAREGIYPEAIEADVSAERLKRFFVKEGNYYHVRREVQDVVLFSSHNILRDPPFSRLDLISCRNLLIYLQRPLQEHIFEIFHYALMPERYVFLGSSEATDTSQELFRVVDKTHRIYQAQPRRGVYPRIPTLPLTVSQTRVQLKPTIPQLQTEYQRALGSGLHQQLLEAVSPPSVLVDVEHHILHVSETAGRYLLQPRGPITNELLKLVRPELQHELRMTLLQAFEHQKPVVSPPVYVQFNGQPHRVVLAVRPQQTMEHVESHEPVALVFFLEDEVNKLAATNATFSSHVQTTSEKSDQQDEQLIEQLQAEVNRLREQLQSNIEGYETSTEELKAANEELQSINEEYRSTTEELETSKEELQSVNEELQTVNSELKNKLEEISRTHSDLENLMASTEIATLFLDRGLHIQRYTPETTKLFNVMSGDRGRPIDHLTNVLLYNDLVKDANELLRTLIPIEREVQDVNGRWLLTRLRPYRTIDDRIDGVVLTFVDISERKQAEEKLRESQERYRLLVETVKEYAMLSIDKAGHISSWNQGSQHIFGYQESEIIGQPLSVIFTEEDQAAEKHLQELESARENGQANDERWHVRKDGSRFWGSGVVTALWEGQNLRGYIKILRDNTERQQLEQNLRKLNETLEERVRQRTRALQDSEQAIRELALQLNLSEQAERERIAQLLHDDLQQHLYALQMQLAFILKIHKLPSTESMAQGFTELNKLMNEATKIAHDLSYELAPPDLHHDGLVKPFQWLIEHVESKYGLHVTLEVAAAQGEQLPTPAENVSALSFRIVRELLFNIVKHAGVNEATLTVSQEQDFIRIQVSDEGAGFDVEQVLHQKPSGYGLATMRRRLDLIGGVMTIESTPQKGTTSTLVIPLKPRNG